MIEIKEMSKVFTSRGTPFTALSDINLTINDGEIFGIIGLSGAGKSTLVRTMNLLEKPTAGSVIVDGTDLLKVSKKELLQIRKSIGMIFQSYNLLEQRNVLKNVLFPLELIKMPKEEARARAMDLLRLVGLEDKAESYPSQLSGGQKQRVAIARALATNPKYLLCDEATSALDPNTTISILDLIQKINKELGVTIIVITHEMSVIDRICNKVAVIDKSHIVEVGNVCDIFASPKSEIAKDLVLPKNRVTGTITGGKKVRIVFNGESAYKPVLSNLIIECGIPVNILFADTKDIDGKAYGQILIGLPDDERKAQRIISWLESNHPSFEMEGSICQTF